MSCSLVAEDFTDEYMIKLDGSGSDAVLSSVAPVGSLSLPSKADANALIWQTTSARLRLARIPELVSMIFNFAMQADGNEIVMPWITGDRTNAGIVTGLLAVK